MTLMLVGCGLQGPEKPSILRDVQQNGVLRVVTTNAPTTYFEGRDGLAGFEYQLIQAYAERLGVEAEFSVTPTVEAVLSALELYQADIAAAGLSVTPQRQTHIAFGPAYMNTAPVLVCRRRVSKITDLSQLNELRFALAKGSSFVEDFERHRLENPALNPALVLDQSVESLLGDIAANKLDCTLADDLVYALHRRYLPILQLQMQMAAGAPLAWAIAGGDGWRNNSLMRDLKYWMAQPQTKQLIAQLHARYFTVADTEFDYVDLSRLRRAMRSRLPKFQDYFVAAGTRYQLPWSLLAAVSWRESHWKPGATSFTGVRGLMMLTRVTAREQGVSDRLDPRQSIFGGARYLAHLLRRLPESIADDQREAFALAAYNMGWGHMMGARQLVASRGGDPDQWAQVSAVLPELENPEVYVDLPHGYARGREGQAYVAAVLNFADIIEKAHAPAIAPDVLRQPATDGQ